MARVGSEKRPIILRVGSENRVYELSRICQEKGFQFIIGIEPDEPENIDDLNLALNPNKPYVKTESYSRNAPCPCGSGKKYKKCCGS